MTLPTSLGPRTLTGAEAVFYLTATPEAFEYLIELRECADELDVVTGDRIFDMANFNQKVFLLQTCLSALLDPQIPPPRQTNLLEATVYFPFAFMKAAISEEIEYPVEFSDDARYQYREMVWPIFEELVQPRWKAADAEYGEDEEINAFHRQSDNYSLWRSVIEDLEDGFFEDYDWQLTSITPQILDGLEESLGEQFGIAPDYITNRLPQVSDAEAKAACQIIQSWRLGIEYPA
jgi:hypothetical protein